MTGGYPHSFLGQFILLDIIVNKVNMSKDKVQEYYMHCWKQ